MSDQVVLDFSMNDLEFVLVLVLCQQLSQLLHLSISQCHLLALC